MDAATRLLRLALMACLLAIGVAVVRNCTETLQGIAHGTRPCTPLPQPTR